MGGREEGGGREGGRREGGREMVQVCNSECVSYIYLTLCVSLLLCGDDDREKRMVSGVVQWSIQQ